MFFSPLLIFHDMYCSLEDAFPQESRSRSKESRRNLAAAAEPGRRAGCNKKEAGIRASCWVKDEEKQQVVMGANVTSAPVPVAASATPARVHQNPEGTCFSALHHCLSCATCQHMLKLHYLSTLPETALGSPEIVMGAQVGRRSLRPSRSGKRKSRRGPLVAAQVNNGGSLNFLNQPILVGSNVTWGHLLIILTAGAFLLLLVDRLKK